MHGTEREGSRVESGTAATAGAAAADLTASAHKQQKRQISRQQSGKPMQ